MTTAPQMKVVYFQRQDTTELDLHMISSANIFFVPAENYLLTVKKRGVGGRWGNILDEGLYINL